MGDHDAQPRRGPSRRVLALAYVVAVAGIATLGFATGSTVTIILAVALTMPASALAVAGYYVCYGLLAMVPGANPSTASGSASCDPSGSCDTVVDGEPAAWFLVASDVLGVAALTAGALLNVLVLGWSWNRREHSRTGAARRTIGL